MANTIDFNVSTNAVTVLNQTTEAAENTAQGFTSAKAELRALQNQMLQMDQTSAEFKKAAERAAELKDNIGDLSAELRANAGNAFEGVSNNISLFGSRLMSLDLKGAGQALTAVGEASKKIGFKEMATELGGLIKGVISLGKALITNPLFLLGTIIATIVTNFDSLSKSGGVLGKILTEIGNLIDWAIQGFTDLTDAIGLTSIAAQKEAEKIKEVAEEIRNELANIDKDISAEKAKALKDFNDNINEAYKSEKDRVDWIIEQNERQMKSYEELYNNGITLNESQNAAYEYLKTSNEKYKEYLKDFSKDVNEFNEKKRKEAADKAKKAQDEKDRLQKEADDKELERRKKLNDEMMAEDDRMASIDIEDLIARQKKKGDAILLTEMQIHANATALRAKQSQEELDELKKAETAKAQLRVDALKTSLSIISDLTTAFAGKSEAQQKKAFNIQKGVSIATATIDTYLAAQGAYRSQMAISTPDAPVRAAIAAGIAIAQGLARVAIISKQQFNGSGSKSGGSSSGGSIPSAGGGMNAPSPANYDFLSQQPNQQPPLQAYVVSTQVSSNLEAQQLINNQARLGG